MAKRLRSALRDTLRGWQEDVEPAWRDVVRSVALAYGDVDPTLEIEPWEPIFPARRGAVFPGAPAGAHMLRAFDGIAPEGRALRDPGPGPLSLPGLRHRPGLRGRQRRAVAGARQDVLAQRPRLHPGDHRRAHRRSPLCPALRRLAGDARRHRIRRGRPGGTRSAGRPLGRLRRAAAQHLAHALALPTRGRSPPAARPPAALAPPDDPGDRASGRARNARRIHRLRRCGGETIQAVAGLRGPDSKRERVILRPHPAEADAFLALENPFALCNRRLQAMGAAAVDW